MSSLIEQETMETLAMMRKSATSGILVGTGAQGVDLSGFTALVPVNVPARMNTSAFPREIAGEGSQLALWRTWLNINNQQSSAAVGVDQAGSMTLFQEQDVYAPYKPLAKAGRVTLDAVAVARNYVDALAQGELQTLNQLFIAQDMMISNGQAWSIVGTPGAATLVPASTGGSIASGTTVYVQYAIRSGVNYFEGGSSIASTQANTTVGTTTSTNSVSASTGGAVKCGVAYDWYVGSSSTTLWYYTTTTVDSVTITSIPSAAASLPSLPLLSALAPGAGVLPLANPAVAGNGHPPTADTSYNANYYNGIMASTLGDYGALGPVTPGSGNPSGGIFIDNGGNSPSLSGGGIDILDKINDQIWASVQLSPTAYMINSLQGDQITSQLLGSGNAPTFLPPTDSDARTNLAGGGFIGRYINRAAGGVPVALEVHPRVAPGTIITRTDYVPFPGSNIGTVFSVRCQYDSMRFDYAANYNPGSVGGGPRYDFEIRSMETLVNRAPLAQAVVHNVG